MFNEVKSKVQADLDKQLMNPKSFLSGFRLIDEKSRLTSSYQDPRYMPFYYHFGKYITPTKITEVGFTLGLKSGCLLKSCKTVSDYFAFTEKSEEYFSPRIGLSNIKQSYDKKLEFHQGIFGDEVFTNHLKGSDLVLVDSTWPYDTTRSNLDYIWAHIPLGSVVMMDFLNENGVAFSDFAKVHNRDAVIFDTRYGVGLLQK